MKGGRVLLDPRTLMTNPVMFVLEVVTALTTVILLLALGIPCSAQLATILGILGGVAAGAIVGGAIARSAPTVANRASPIASNPSAANSSSACALPTGPAPRPRRSVPVST